jgi:uncharacterized protein YndB with AHSA1/START domain
VRKLSASRELLAPLEDVWAFVAEPHNFPNWWPRIGGVQPDRRGLAPGARWQVIAESEPSLLRRPASTGQLLVLAVEHERRLAFRLTAERLELELTLEPVAANRTRARLEVRGSWWAGLSRSLPRGALDRLWALCQTGAA